MLLGAYLLFVLFRLARLARASARTLQIRRAAHETAVPELLERVRIRCQEAYGLARVDLLFSAQIAGPLTAGRTIILPESMRAEEQEDVLTAAIGHEMAHIARHDFACNLLYELLYLPMSFHPAAGWIRRGIERTREMACDELVTGRLIDAGVYARSIVSIATGMTVGPRPGYTLGRIRRRYSGRAHPAVAGAARGQSRARTPAAGYGPFGAGALRRGGFQPGADGARPGSAHAHDEAGRSRLQSRRLSGGGARSSKAPLSWSRRT